jgi:hypothetical protein
MQKKTTFKKLSIAAGAALMMTTTGAMAQATLGAGVVRNDDSTGFSLGFERTPYAMPGIATEASVRQIDFDGVENITGKAGIGFGTNLPDQIGHSISGLVGVRADHYDRGLSDEYGGYVTARYRYAPVAAIQLGADVTYTMIDANAAFDREGLTPELIARYQFTKGAFLEARYQVDVDDTIGSDVATVGLRLSY